MEDQPEQIRGAFFKAHEYILIRPYKNASDIRYINNHSMKVNASGQSEVLVGDIQYASVVRMVRGWNITETKKQPDGTSVEVPVPFDRLNVEASVDKLPGPYFEFIFAEITRRNPPLTQEAQNGFLTPVTNGSLAELSISQPPS